MTTIAKRLEKFYPCGSAVIWLGKRTNMKKAWVECPRPDWLLWIAGQVNVDRRLLVAAACDCAETALQYVPAGEERPAKCIAVTRAWVAGTATLEEVGVARNAVYAAANAAANAAAYAANAAADAAAYAAANAAAAADAAAYAARKQAQKAMCKMVRKRIPFFYVAKALKEGK